MKKEFTIDNFTKSDWYKSIEETGTWSTFSNKWDINYSSILTELIHNAGRWCERFASDLFISAGIIAITSCEDATAGIIIAALGICLLITKKQVMEF